MTEMTFGFLRESDSDAKSYTIGRTIKTNWVPRKGDIVTLWEPHERQWVVDDVEWDYGDAGGSQESSPAVFLSLSPWCC